MTTGVIGANVIQLLRLLTPNAISKLSPDYAKKKRVSLSKMIVDDESGAIGPNTHSASGDQNNVIPLKQVSKKNNNSEEKKPSEKELLDHSSSTIFLIKEKEKSKKSEYSLKRKEVIELYQTLSKKETEVKANIKMDNERPVDDDDLDDVNQDDGLLLKRKRA